MLTFFLKIFQILYSVIAWFLFIPTVITSLLASRMLIMGSTKQPERLFFRSAGRVGAFWGRLIGIRFFSDPMNPKRIEDDQSYVFVANHMSFLDLIALTYGAPVGYRVLSKIENRRMPIFGYTIAPILIPVDRSSHESRLASMEVMTSYIQKGTSILVFPEGTRNKNFSEPLGPSFYDGAFRIAINHQIPMVPMIITGSRNCMEANGLLFSPGKVGVHLFEPVPTQGMSLEDLPELKQKMYDIMASNIRETDPYFQQGSAPSSLATESKH